MAKSGHVQLRDGTRVPVLYEDRSVLALDKPPGWLLAPASWRHTGRNLQAALESEIAGGAFWARTRNLRFLRFVHRLDAETSGVLLCARSPGALRALSRLFESRQVDKTYLAIVRGRPPGKRWHSAQPLAPHPDFRGVMRVDARHGKPAETDFGVLAEHTDADAGWLTLVEARPLTGRTHQIRVHLAEAGYPVLGDELYGGSDAPGQALALRAVGLRYQDPFTRRPVRICAPTDGFLSEFGFNHDVATPRAGNPKPQPPPGHGAVSGTTRASVDNE